MSSPFFNVHYNVADKPPEETEELRSPATRGVARGAKPSFHNDEAAARHYLGAIFAKDTRAPVRGITAPARPAAVPDMRALAVPDSDLLSTRLVKFEQTRQGVPVFGTNAVVELDKNRELVSVQCQIADLGNRSAIATRSPQEAIEAIARLTSVPVETLMVSAPTVSLVFFFDEDGDEDWHLAYLAEKVPAAPPGTAPRGHGLKPGPRRHSPLVNYIVDAHSNKVLFHYSAVPMLTKCTGLDEEGRNVIFYGQLVGATKEVELYDELRQVRTFDNQQGDIDDPAPLTVLKNPSAQWANANVAAVSAHIGAAKVSDFLSSVLKRQGIDNRGMVIESIVNCTYKADQLPPEWDNAVWWNDRMWYGQRRDKNGNLRSFARYLDIIAHEMMHGVTEKTANLVYKNMSGALNESFSDIFGVVVHNMFADPPELDVGKWNWEIGKDLAAPGVPLRDMANPRKTKDPEHMEDYLKTTADEGGVHTNSNIHNKAAHNVLTAKLDGSWAFDPKDVAILYYLTLMRVGPLAKFKDVLATLLDVAKSYFAGDADGGRARVDALRVAYAKVGIE